MRQMKIVIVHSHHKKGFLITMDNNQVILNVNMRKTDSNLHQRPVVRSQLGCKFLELVK